jgi:hypothetical protein
MFACIIYSVLQVYVAKRTIATRSLLTLIAAFFCYHTQIATLNGCKALSSKFLTTLVDHCRHMQLLEICGAAADDGAKSRQQFPGGTQNFPILQRPFFCLFMRCHCHLSQLVLICVGCLLADNACCVCCYTVVYRQARCNEQ